MKAVFFPEEMNERAPHAVGILAEEPSTNWLTLVDIVEAMRRGETVTIRPASAREIKRAEAYIAMFEIGKALGEKMHALLDQDTPGVAAEKIAAVGQLLDQGSVYFPGLLDIAKEAG